MHAITADGPVYSISFLPSHQPDPIWFKKTTETETQNNLDQKKLQVAQPLQRDHAKLDTFLINVQRYSQNHAQNRIFGPSYGDIRGNICALSEIFNTKKPRSRVSSRQCQF